MPPQVLKTPEAEVDITLPLIQKLLQSQHPDLANLPLEILDTGWDNSMFRLGSELTIRLPRRQKAVPLLQIEQEWLPKIAKDLPIPTPIPLRIGKPAFDYPWVWSILPWLEGQAADLEAPTSHQATPMVKFLQALHLPAPQNAPKNAGRGVPIQYRAADVELRLQRLQQKTNLITKEIHEIWKDALKADKANKHYWVHGDLHPRNILVKDKCISAVIDWGDLTSGDVATDLACIWMLFEEKKARQKAIEEYAPSASLLARSKGWAVFFGAVLLDTGLVDNPRHALIGEKTLKRVAEDF